MAKTSLSFTPQLLPVPGSRVGFVCGPGQFPKDDAGKVLCHVTDRWGTHAVVLMDTGATRTLTGLTDVGIGAHLIAGEARPAGYTLAYQAEGGPNSMRILVRPETDLDGTFMAWDLDNGGYARLNGWVWTFEQFDPDEPDEMRNGNN